MAAVYDKLSSDDDGFAIVIVPVYVSPGVRDISWLMGVIVRELVFIYIS